MTTQANTNAKAKNLGKYLRGVKSELKKVNWPNKAELKNHTGVVIASCILATIVLWALDTFFGFGLGLIIR
ncbi:preprotein translocase subunit SecE [Natronincola ferrireducens]|uniref:Protein translocase subunit SecE n=1 Tax=Natronincola ferrireducens TaxID=393762 RepID=A0A1G9J612_9FIRM|nr:preprotein translocase subunit SecE [Natronincola ferrireducens]SDL32594.1 protein translocase subunit secE/sec61 gamma [Natronincola ferrireducens]